MQAPLSVLQWGGHVSLLVCSLLLPLIKFRRQKRKKQKRISIDYKTNLVPGFSMFTLSPYCSILLFFFLSLINPRPLLPLPRNRRFNFPRIHTAHACQSAPAPGSSELVSVSSSRDGICFLLHIRVASAAVGGTGYTTMLNYLCCWCRDLASPCFSWL